MPEIQAAALFAGTDGRWRQAAYAQLAATGPVHRVVLPTGEPAWLITGYAELRAALHDPRLVKSAAAQSALSRDWLPPEVFAAMTQNMRR